MRRVVITGLGMVTPVGLSAPDTWQAVLAGRSGAGRITRFDPSALPVQIAAEVKGFDGAGLLGAKLSRQVSLFVQFAAQAAKEALEDSGLDVGREGDRCGCMIGVGLGAFGDIEEQAHVFREQGPRRVSPLLLPYAIPNMAAGFVALTHGLRGPGFSTATACASGTHAVGEAFLHVATGTADAIVAGGAEAATSALSIASFARMRALSTRNTMPESASRPFDRDRDGFVMGEGSGVLVLEELEHAQRRGARIYAEIAGYGLTTDACHITLPHAEGQGIARAMCAAIRAARLQPYDVDYINAHGTSTPANDVAESAAIEVVFAEHARRLAVSSTKGSTAHCLGAAGAIEAALTALAIQDQVVPPTANLETPDPACRLDYTPRQPRERCIRHALSNSCGFGGHNATLLLTRLE
jgi:3-oxoacyl-[acyl-carrier-protein] synthase II